ncbi:MAG: hypothetical protein H6842_07430 [Rhodospirillaceae bacterium]|nr:hypothetical protein [Rhodospirillaceae bacterium]
MVGIAVQLFETGHQVQEMRVFRIDRLVPEQEVARPQQSAVSGMRGAGVVRLGLGNAIGRSVLRTGAGIAAICEIAIVHRTTVLRGNGKGSLPASVPACRTVAEPVGRPPAGIARWRRSSAETLKEQLKVYIAMLTNPINECIPLYRRGATVARCGVTAVQRGGAPAPALGRLGSWQIALATKVLGATIQHAQPQP